MHWIAPSERDTDPAALEKRLWDAADPFRAHSGLKSQEYSAPVPGLIFVRFAGKRPKMEGDAPSSPKRFRHGSRGDRPAASLAEGSPAPIRRGTERSSGQMARSRDRYRQWERHQLKFL